MRCRGALAISAAVLLAAPCPAQDESAAIDLSGRVELARLVDLAAARLGLNIEYDESALRGTVTLRLGGNVNDDELWGLTSRLLASNGLTTVRMAGSQTLTVVKLSDAPGLVRIEGLGARAGAPHDALLPATGNDNSAPSAGFEAIVARVQHMSPSELIDAVKPALSKSGQLTVLGKTDLVLVQDLRPRVEQVLALIERIDSPAPDVVIEEIVPAQVSAARLAASVSQAVSARDAVAGQPLRGQLSAIEGKTSLLLVAPLQVVDEWRGLIERLDRAEPIERRSYRARHFRAAQVAALVEELFGAGAAGGVASADAPALVVDDLTDTLFVAAAPSRHEEIAALIERLDAPEGGARQSMRTYAVRNRAAGEVVSLLNQLLGASAGGAGVGAAERGALGHNPAAAAPAARGDVAAAEPGVRRAPDGGDAARAGAGADVRTASGFVGPPLLLTADEATSSIIAIGEPRVLDQVEALLNTLDVRQPQVVLDVTIVALTEGQTFDLGVELEKFEMYGDTLVRLASLFGLSSSGGGGRTVGDPVGFSGVILNPGDFSVVVRALETVNEGRNLSLPRVLVDNNQQATLDAVREEPFLSVNASDTVATTSFGGAASAGTQISLRPQIAEGDHLLLEYDISLSSFVGESSDPSLPPPRQDSSISSVATIPDGHAIVLGGLETRNEGDAESRVPLIGRVPLVGELFKSRSRSGSRTRFYVFIRASVMRGESFEYLKYISARGMEELGLEDGWPEVRPRIIR